MTRLVAGNIRQGPLALQPLVPVQQLSTTLSDVGTPGFHLRVGEHLAWERDCDASSWRFGVRLEHPLQLYPGYTHEIGPMTFNVVGRLCEWSGPGTIETEPMQSPQGWHQTHINFTLDELADPAEAENQWEEVIRALGVICSVAHGAVDYWPTVDHTTGRRRLLVSGTHESDPREQVCFLCLCVLHAC